MEQLKRLREERGLSQVKLAARADIDPSTVNQIERGAREASPATLRKLAEALDVSIADLLEDTSPKASAPSSQARLFDGISEQQRRALDRIEEFCNQLEEAVSKGHLDEPIINTAFRGRIVDLGSMIPALYENEAIRQALHPLATRFLELARQLPDKVEGSNARDNVIEPAATTEDTHNVIDATDSFLRRAS